MNKPKKTKIKSIASLVADAERKTDIKKSALTTSPPSLKDIPELIKSTQLNLTVDQLASGSLYSSGSSKDRIAKIQATANYKPFPDLKDTIKSMSLGDVSKQINAGIWGASGIDAINKEFSKIGDIFKRNQIEIQSVMQSAFLGMGKSISEQMKESFSNSLKTTNIKFLESPIQSVWRENSKRSKRLLAIFKQAKDMEFNLHDAIERELQDHGALNSQQLLWFFVELGGVDTSKLIEAESKRLQGLAVAREKSSKNKSERSLDYHAKWNKWAGETLKANPTWNLDKIADHVLSVAEKYNHKMSNGQLYKVGTIKNAIKGFKKNI